MKTAATIRKEIEKLQAALRELEAVEAAGAATAVEKTVLSDKDEETALRKILEKLLHDEVVVTVSSEEKQCTISFLGMHHSSSKKINSKFKLFIHDDSLKVQNGTDMFSNQSVHVRFSHSSLRSVKDGLLLEMGMGMDLVSTLC